MDYRETLDAAVLGTFPLFAIPPSGKIAEPTKYGVRYLIGRSQIWREVTLAWIETRAPFGQSLTCDLPYGETINVTCFKMGALPTELIQQFVFHAKAACPLEIAGALLWNEHAQTWRLAMRESIKATNAHVDYREVQMQDGEHLVVDIHSHGKFDAHFSMTDDIDDAGAMKISLVVGNLDAQKMTYAMRLCMLGKFTQLDLLPRGALEVV